MALSGPVIVPLASAIRNLMDTPALGRTGAEARGWPAAAQITGTSALHTENLVFA
jgi:hypothetical protein